MLKVKQYTLILHLSLNLFVNNKFGGKKLHFKEYTLDTSTNKSFRL